MIIIIKEENFFKNIILLQKTNNDFTNYLIYKTE